MIQINMIALCAHHTMGKVLEGPYRESVVELVSLLNNYETQAAHAVLAPNRRSAPHRWVALRIWHGIITLNGVVLK